tara:strand:+ start:437 stop:739 length:303 start_codon:yes stop_codon:yes gene_type:complete
VCLLGVENAAGKSCLPDFIVLFLSFISKPVSMFFILLIKIYRLCLSPFLGSSCRFDPTCSEYGIDAFKKYSLIKAFALLTKRVFRCHPFNSGGADPLPKP